MRTGHTIHRYLLVAITLIGALIRIPELRYGIWRDEGTTYFESTASTFAQLLHDVIRGELNPPAYYILTRASTHIFGTGELALKLPALACGILLIPACYLLGRTLGSRITGLGTATICAFSDRALWQSQEARPYTLAALLACLTVVAYCNALKGSARWIAAFVIAGALLIYTQYTGLVLIGSLGVVTAVLVWRREPSLPIVRLCIAFTLIFALFLPWIAIFLDHLNVGTPWFDAVPTVDRIPMIRTNMESAMPSGFVDFLSIPVFVIIMIGAWKTFRRRESSSIAAPDFCVGACLMIAIFVQSWRSYDTSRYMFASAPFAWVIMVRVAEYFLAASKRAWPKHVHRAVVVAAVTASLVALIIPAVAMARESGARSKSGIRVFAGAKPDVSDTLFVIAPDYLASTFAYYFRGISAHYLGFARADHPEQFTPRGYANVWQRPEAVAEAEARIDSEVSRGAYRKLALIYDAVGDQGGMPYHKSAELKDHLLGKYRLISEKTYDGVAERCTIYVFEL